MPAAVRRAGVAGMSWFSLREAGAEDGPFLEDMVVAAANWDPGRPAADRDQVLANPHLAHYAAAWPRAGDLGVVATDESGAKVGAAWLRCFTGDDPGYGFVAADVPEMSIGVRLEWRGNGVGRALLRELLRQGARHGVTRVSLSVERANRARHLYLSEGFTVVESGADADTMVRLLQP